MSVVNQPNLPSDTALLTEDFLKSRFWLEVLKPQLEYEEKYCADCADGANDPDTCYRWTARGAGFRAILYGWFPEWEAYFDVDN